MRDVLNGTGTDEDSIEYTAYGDVVNQTGPTYGGVILFDAYRLVVAADLDLTPNRVYSPVTGSWTSEDPLAFDAGDSNFYRYVQNNPTNATDPSGLKLIIGDKTMPPPS